ncbi:MAG: nicotinate phosphoribosyltransferase [Kofleriaceae bacterium]
MTHPASPLSTLYRSSLALATDLYQLTMACGYWQAGVADREAVFHLTFRREPFAGGYAVCAGTSLVTALLAQLRFDDSDLTYLATLTGADGRPLFPPAFLAYLGQLRFTGSVDVVPEGSVVFAHEPLVRVRAPIAVAQLVETALLTLVNFSTLIATKASRIVAAAAGQPVLEFGLRRAQGLDGGITASRAAWIGGTAATSNVLAGKLYGLPVRGTHAHSWVMFWGDDATAFAAYADAMPGATTFLVDTFDTAAGVEAAIEVGHTLRARGHELGGVRLDSGDLAHLSIAARARLDAAGFPGTKVVASNDLDEHVIASLRAQGACIDTWGVGTKLVTAHDQPALGGVYKLGAVREPDGSWRYPIKLSEQPIKISTPGIVGVRRVWRDGQLLGDVLYDVAAGPSTPRTAIDVAEPSRRTTLVGDREEDLLVPAIVDGVVVDAGDDLPAARARATAQLAALSPRTRRTLNPQPHPVGLDPVLHDRKLALIAAARRGAGGPA